MFGRWRKVAEVRQNLVGNSIGVVGREHGNLLAGTVAEAGNTIIVISHKTRTSARWRAKKITNKRRGFDPHLGL